MEKVSRLASSRITGALDAAISQLKTLEKIPLYPDHDALDALVRSGDDASLRLRDLLLKQWELESVMMARRSASLASAGNAQGGAGAGAAGARPRSAFVEVGEGDGRKKPPRIGAAADHHGAGEQSPPSSFHSREEMHEHTRLLLHEVQNNGRGRIILGGAASSGGGSRRADGEGGKGKSCSPLKSLVEDLKSLRRLAEARVGTTVEETEARDAQYRKVREHHDATTAEVRRLERRLELQRSEQRDRLASLELRLAKTTSELESAAGKHKAEQETQDELEERAIARARSEHERTVEKLREEKEELEARARDAAEAHREEERTLREKRSELEQDLSNLVQKYESQVSTLDTKIGDIRAKMTREQTEREELQEHYRLVERNEGVRLDEEDTLAEIGRIEAEADAVLDRGASQLQRLFRGRRDRAAVLKMKQKGKKKGKGKKGKGKAGGRSKK